MSCFGMQKNEKSKSKFLESCGSLNILNYILETSPSTTHHTIRETLEQGLEGGQAPEEVHGQDRKQKTFDVRSPPANNVVYMRWIASPDSMFYLCHFKEWMGCIPHCVERNWLLLCSAVTWTQALTIYVCGASVAC